MEQARAKPHPVAVIAGAGGALVALGYLLVGGAFLLDVQRVADRLGGAGVSGGISQLLLGGCVVALVTLYVSYRTARGGVAAMFLLALLNAGFAIVTRDLLKPTPGGGRDPVGGMLGELLRRRLQSLQPLGVAAIVVAVVAGVAAVLTLLTRQTSTV